jgi:ATP-dependent Clp protease ATP-binding subunit ClpC
MAITYRFPILVWEDLAGTFTARLVEYEHNVQLIFSGKVAYDSADSTPTAVGLSKDDAIYKLKEYISWSYQEYPWQPMPDFYDAKLIFFRVEVRPEYRRAERIFPVDLVALKLPCIYGRQEEGLLVCSIPTIGVHFYYYDHKTLKDLVNHYAQEKLKGLTPRELSRFLPPKKVFLEEIVMPITYKRKSSKVDVKLPTLSTIAQPVTERGSKRRFGRAWERDTEVAELIRRITQEKANIIIVGESGIGKSTLLADAASQIERQLRRTAEINDDSAYKNYKNKFWSTSGARIIAGMRYLGQWEERCEELIRELSDISGILCLENILDAVNSGGESPINGIAAFLIPYIQRGELKVIVEATPAELDSCRRLLPGFIDLFQILSLESFSKDKAINILDRLAQAFEQNFSIQITKGVTELIYRLFSRFMPYQSFPGKTVAFLQELFERAKQNKKKNVTLAQVIKLFIDQTGLPELFLRDEIPLIPNEVVKQLASQVIGQKNACQTAANLITTFKAGLNDTSRPIGVLLFCGPTGVGKTELAKALSKFFFGAGAEKERLIRLDMSEYSTPGSAARLIGQDFNQPSSLIKKVRQQPFVVVLLDEVEKANKEVFDLFLGLFDEGRLTDQFGRTTIFRSAIIIMTSNIGADKFTALGFQEQSKSSYTSAVMDFFRPEFFNRIDAVVNFGILDKQVIEEITEKELSELTGREGLERSKVKLTWTNNLVKHLTKIGYEPRYGARPLQRTIEKLVVIPLARYLIENPEVRGELIKVDVDISGKVYFQVING